MLFTTISAESCYVSILLSHADSSMLFIEAWLMHITWSCVSQSEESFRWLPCLPQQYSHIWPAGSQLFGCLPRSPRQPRNYHLDAILVSTNRNSTTWSHDKFWPITCEEQTAYISINYHSISQLNSTILFTLHFTKTQSKYTKVTGHMEI